MSDDILVKCEVYITFYVVTQKIKKDEKNGGLSFFIWKLIGRDIKTRSQLDLIETNLGYRRTERNGTERNGANQHRS